MNVLLDVCLYYLKRKSGPLLSEGTVKRTYMTPYQIHRRRQLTKNKNSAIAKVGVLVEQVIL